MARIQLSRNNLFVSCQYLFCYSFPPFSSCHLANSDTWSLSQPQAHCRNSFCVCRWHCWDWLGVFAVTGTDIESVLSLTLLRLTPLFSWHCWDRLRCFVDTAEIDPAVRLELRRLTPLFPWHCWNWIPVPLTLLILTYIDSTVSLTLLRLTPLFHWHCWDWLRCFVDTAEIDPAVRLELRRLTPLFPWHCWNWIPVLLTLLILTYIDSTVSLTLLRLTPLFHWHC